LDPRGGWSAKELFEELNAMLQSRQANKECIEMLSETLEYAAWKLAKDDLDNVVSWAWISNDPESFLVSSFLQNLELLRSIRRLIMTVSPGILAERNMGELSLGDLVMLRDALLTSWYKVELRGLIVESTELQLWVTLEVRA
jgi:hypothetical protein